MIIKYVLCPGHVMSQSDGQVHYIGPSQLIKLYGVNPKECVVYNRLMPSISLGLIRLTPRYDGDYKVPGRGLTIDPAKGQT